MKCRRIATLTVMAALCIGIQLTPRPPNFEFTSLICFLSGFLFGPWFGALLGALTMFINGFLSPWGFAGIIMPFQMLGMALMGFAGGTYRKLLGNDFSRSKSLNFESACLAAFLTLIYDIITNAGYAVLFNLEIVIVLIAGVWFSIIHVASNTILFGVAFHRLVKIIGSLAGESL